MVYKKYLKGANLEEVNFFNADLRGANLSNVSARDGWFRLAKLTKANLQYGDFRGADFRHANLRGANLKGANLKGANLEWADLRDTKGLRLSRAQTEHAIIGEYTDIRNHRTTVFLVRLGPSRSPAIASLYVKSLSWKDKDIQNQLENYWADPMRKEV